MRKKAKTITGTVTYEWRVTRPHAYQPGCPGHDDASARQGYYVQAESAQAAANMVDAPGNVFDVQYWDNRPAPGMPKTKRGDMIGSFFRVKDEREDFEVVE